LSKDLHKLAALRLLADAMSELKTQYQPRIERGDNSAEVERETAQKALNGRTEAVGSRLDKVIE